MQGARPAAPGAGRSAGVGEPSGSGDLGDRPRRAATPPAAPGTPGRRPGPRPPGRRKVRQVDALRARGRPGGQPGAAAPPGSRTSAAHGAPTAACLVQGCPRARVHRHLRRRARRPRHRDLDLHRAVAGSTSGGSTRAPRSGRSPRAPGAHGQFDQRGAGHEDLPADGVVGQPGLRRSESRPVDSTTVGSAARRPRPAADARRRSSPGRRVAACGPRRQPEPLALERVASAAPTAAPPARDRRASRRRPPRTCTPATAAATAPSAHRHAPQTGEPRLTGSLAVAHRGQAPRPARPPRTRHPGLTQRGRPRRRTAPVSRTCRTQYPGSVDLADPPPRRSAWTPRDLAAPDRTSRRPTAANSSSIGSISGEWNACDTVSRVVRTPGPRQAPPPPRPPRRRHRRPRPTRAVDRGDIDTGRARPASAGPRPRAAHRDHRAARRQRLHQPAPRRDHRARVGQRQHPGHMRGGELDRSNARPRRSGTHTPRLQQPDNATSTANNAGCVNPCRPGAARRRIRSSAATRPRRSMLDRSSAQHRVERLREHRERLVQLPAHPDPLRTLTREQERGLRRRRATPVTTPRHRASPPPAAASRRSSSSAARPTTTARCSSAARRRRQRPADIPPGPARATVGQPARPSRGGLRRQCRPPTRATTPSHASGLRPVRRGDASAGGPARGSRARWSR